jgi:hypothetical protein
LEISNVWEHWNISNEINVILEQVMAENNEVSWWMIPADFHGI